MSSSVASTSRQEEQDRPASGASIAQVLSGSLAHRDAELGSAKVSDGVPVASSSAETKAAQLGLLGPISASSPPPSSSRLTVASSPRPSVTPLVPPAETEEESPNWFEIAHERKSSDRSDLHRSGHGGSGEAGEHGERGSDETHPYIQAHYQPLSYRHLFKKPVIRQWIHDGRLFREEAAREPSRFELVFDLAFVGVVHQLADGAAENATGMGVAKFLLTFYPSWSVWQDVRNFINVSGTDDFLHRLYILFSMCILVGYSANASSIQVEHEVDEQTGAYHYFFAGGYHQLIRIAVSFFLVAKLSRILLHVFYGWYLPNFRVAQWCQALANFVPTLLFVPLLFVKSALAIVLWTCAGVAWELMSRYVLGLTMILLQRRGMSAGKDLFVPAINVEHLVERMALFVILVLGEVILDATYKASQQAEFGLSEQFGRSAMAIFIAFFLIWLYFDADSARVFQHALRRNWVTSITFTHLHWPLCAGYILMSVAIQAMVKLDQIESGFRWFFGGSIATVLVVTTTLGLLHKSLDAPHSALLPRSCRLVARLLVAIFFALFPLVHDLSSLFTLSVHAGVLAALVIFEMVSKLGAIPAEFAAYEKYFYEDEIGYRPPFMAFNGHFGDARDGWAQDLTRRVELEMAELGHDGEPPATVTATAGSAPRPSPVPSAKVEDPAESKKRQEERIQRRLSQAFRAHEQDLTAPEKGDQDVGLEGDLGHMKVQEIPLRQRLAYMS